ncbi:MAG: heme-copper oxidase subunit III, partial [Actinomycetota bacterium]|nr:heme-copper oxidase subunit III [Actinomycetota bacterium]
MSGARELGAPATGEPRRFPVTVLGMILFVAGEVMFFGALFAAYFTLRDRAAEWPPPGTPEIDLVLPAILTLALLASSFTAHRAVGAFKQGDRRRLTRWLWITIALGSVFLAGEATEWARLIGEDFTVSTNTYGTLFFT